MGYRLENREIELSGLRKLNFVPSTKAGDVYRYKNVALRVFRDGEMPIEEETAKYFTGITTKRILLPRKLLFYNNAFHGYTMKLVSQKGAGKRITTTPKWDLIDNVEVLEEDTETLSQKHILLNGITPGYTLFNGELYIVNPAAHSIFEGGDTRQLNDLNQYQLHLLMTELIASDLRKSGVSQTEIQYMKKLMSAKDPEQYCSDYLREIMAGQNNVRELVKKIS